MNQSGDHLHRSWILVALMLTMMLAAMDTTIVSTAIPQIVGDLGGFALFSWVFSIYLLAQTVTIPVYGKLADLFGRKPVLIFGVLIFLAGSAASAAAWNMTSLILFRGLQGLGAGSIMATVNTLAGDLYDIRERSRVQGWLSSVWGMAAIVGPALGGAFAQYASWRWIFLINLPIGIAALVLIGIFLHEKAPGRRHRVDFAGAGMMLVTGTVLIYTLLQGGQAWPWLSLQSTGLMILTVLLVAITIRMERRSADPIMPDWIWRDPVLIGANLSVIGMGIIMIGPEMYLPVFSQSVLGLGAITAGFVLASMSVGWPLTSALSGRLYLHIGFRNTALWGAVLIILAAAGFWLLPYPGPVWLVVADQIVLGGGFGLLSTPMLVGVQSVVTWDRRGVVTGANMFSRYLGQSVGAALFGAVFNAAIGDALTGAPSTLQARLPRQVNTVIQALQSGQTGKAAERYLRHAFYIATHHIYIGLAVTGLMTLVVLLFTPRHFPVAEEK
ncbi:MAG TPA: MDR family MFS transporter [Chitinophagaceae bacterium]|nr:MDR family MFS transporter [Chitinophagaceae bacterium]